MVKIESNGGYRFIGSNLCEQPIVKNLEVVIIDDLSKGLKSNLVNFESTFHKSYQDKKNVSLKCHVLISQQLMSVIVILIWLLLEWLVILF